MPDNQRHFLDFIRGSFKAIAIGDPVSKVHKIYGTPSSIEGDTSSGYLYYGMLRFCYSDGGVDEIGFHFLRMGEEALQFDLGGDVMTLNQHSSVLSLFLLVNELGIPWIAGGRIVFGIQAFLPQASVLIKAFDHDGLLLEVKTNANLQGMSVADFVASRKL